MKLISLKFSHFLWPIFRPLYVVIHNTTHKFIVTDHENNKGPGEDKDGDPFTPEGEILFRFASDFVRACE